MPVVGGTTRKLNYPLNRTEDMLSDTTDGVVDNTTLSAWATTDNDERIDIVLNLSLNEYIALSNSIDVGRDIAYGDNSLEIWWIWIRSLQTMSICASMIDCIANNIDVQNAIQAISGGDPNINGNPNKWLLDAIEPVAGCDKDTTWGYVDALWTYLNQQNVDFLESLDEASNTLEQLENIMEAIPLFGLLPYDDIVEWLGDLGEYNLDAYNASITTAIQDEIKCDLFCLAVENDCHLTFEMVWDYMLDRFGGATFPTLGATFAELVFFMVTGVYTSDRIVFLWTLVQLGVAFIGGRFLGTSAMNQIAIHAQTGDPDNDWELLCEDCGWIYNSDFTDNDNGWFAAAGLAPYDAPRAIYSTGNGWLYQDIEQSASIFYRWCGIGFTMPSTHIDNITMVYDLTKGVIAGGTAICVIVQAELGGGGFVSQSKDFNSTDNGSSVGLTLNVNDDVVEIKVTVRASSDFTSINNLTGDCQVVAVNVSGTGDNPF